jgi:hypothetical protein
MKIEKCKLKIAKCPVTPFICFLARNAKKAMNDTNAINAMNASNAMNAKDTEKNYLYCKKKNSPRDRREHREIMICYRKINHDKRYKN